MLGIITFDGSVLTNVLSIEPAPKLVRLVVASEIIGNHINFLSITLKTTREVNKLVMVIL